MIRRVTNEELFKMIPGLNQEIKKFDICYISGGKHGIEGVFLAIDKGNYINDISWYKLIDGSRIEFDYIRFLKELYKLKKPVVRFQVSKDSIGKKLLKKHKIIYERMFGNVFFEMEDEKFEYYMVVVKYKEED